MPAKQRASSSDDYSSSVEEINVNKVFETRQELDKIRYERDKQRAQLQEDLDKKIADLHKRIKQITDAHTNQLNAITKQQIDCLVQAIEARDAIDCSIREKLQEMHDESENLAMLLDRAYGHRIQKTQAVIDRDAEQRQSVDQDEQDRPKKKVRLDTRSLST